MQPPPTPPPGQPPHPPQAGQVTWLVPWERTWGMAVHLASLSGYAVAGFGWIVGPLIVWMLKKDQSAYVDAQGKEALNFNLSLLIYGFVSALLAVVGIGFVMLFTLFVIHLVCTITAAVRANNGERYRYPFTIRMIT